MFDISRLSALIFDLDGVIWRGNMPVPGAVESVARLRAAGKRCFYCTNNSRKAPADFVAALASMGIEAEEDEIMTSSSATRFICRNSSRATFRPTLSAKTA
jgi:4-nitrophenyl phosphatase